MISRANLYAFDLCTATFCIDIGMDDTTLWVLGLNILLNDNFNPNRDDDSDDDTDRASDMLTSSCELGINSASFGIRLGSEDKPL